MMRITFVVPGLESSGGARIIAGHAKRLAERGHDVLIVGPGPRSPTLKERAKSVLGRGALPGRLKHSHYERIQVPIHVIGSEGPLRPEDVPEADVIIATFWTTAEWIWPLPSSKGVKVHFIQGYEDFPGLPIERLEAVWRLPIYKIAVAQWLVDLGRERFGIEEMALVPNSIDHHYFNATRRTKGNPPTIGFLFSGASFKDMPTTIAAVERLRQAKPDTRVISFGVVPPGRGQLPRGTEFHHLPRQEVIGAIYGRCDAWLSTSRTEGFNLPPLEAMAAGCPAVCAKTGRPLEIIDNGVNGYLVDQGDVEGFTDALARILSLSDQEWNKMSEAAIRAVAHPTWAESSALFEDALMQSVSNATFERASASRSV
jgi:glycosyltransferase involved in cell wall biosynthesis